MCMHAQMSTCVRKTAARRRHRLEPRMTTTQKNAKALSALAKTCGLLSMPETYAGVGQALSQSKSLVLNMPKFHGKSTALALAAVTWVSTRNGKGHANALFLSYNVRDASRLMTTFQQLAARLPDLTLTQQTSLKTCITTASGRSVRCYAESLTADSLRGSSADAVFLDNASQCGAHATHEDRRAFMALCAVAPILFVAAGTAQSTSIKTFNTAIEAAHSVFRATDDVDAKAP